MIFFIPQMKQICPNLTRFLDNRAILSQLPNLPSILELQNLLIKKCSGRLDQSTVREKTIENLLFDGEVFGTRYREAERLTKIYLDTFNALANDVFGYGLVIA